MRNETGETRTSPPFPLGHGARPLKRAKIVVVERAPFFPRPDARCCPHDDTTRRASRKPRGDAVARAVAKPPSANFGIGVDLIDAIKRSGGRRETGTHTNRRPPNGGFGCRCLQFLAPVFRLDVQRFSNGKITFQSFFMSITVHLFTAAASSAASRRPKCDCRS